MIRDISSKGRRVSSNQGRTWRPEKKINRRDSRRLRIYLVAAILSVLVGAVAFLISGRAVPPIRFIVITEHDFRIDESSITPLPGGGTALNGSHIAKLANEFHEADSIQIAETKTYASLSEFVSDTSPPSGERLVIYCAVDAWNVLSVDDPQKTVLELLPARLSDERIRFSEFLEGVKQRRSVQTVLLLELTGRFPGLASGSVADDISGQIRKEIDAAGISGLTVICASSQGERSWEFVAAASADAGTNTTGKTSARPEFSGTAFGHFIAKALLEGNAGTAEKLYATLNSDISQWVSGHFGETQTVWMRSPDPRAATKELLQRPKVSKAKKTESQASGRAEPETKASAETVSKPAGEKTDTTEAAGSAAEDAPVARLKKLYARRDAIASQSVTAILHPAEWLQLQTYLVAAERLAMNGNRSEFDSLHDDILQRILNELERQAAIRSASPDRQAMDDWIADAATVTVSDDQARLLRRTQSDFSVEPAKAPKDIPDEFHTNPGLRRALVDAVIKDLKELSESIAVETPEAKLRVQERVQLMQNLASRWQDEVFPEQWATIREVMNGSDTEWLTAVMKPLVRLLDLRHEALQLAAGNDPDGKPLRFEHWRQVAADADDILKMLHAAERWLSMGPEGKELADDRLDKASQALVQLKERVTVTSRLVSIQDAQRFQVPFLIQYLAMRLETTSLQPEELTAAKSMAAKAVAGTVTETDFPTGQLKSVGFTTEVIEAMFALTRDFSRSQLGINEADERHFAVLERYLTNRLSNPATTSESVSASESMQLLQVPLVSNRDELLRGLMVPRSRVSTSLPDASSRSGIWLSFWSLRLAEAIGQRTSAEDWKKWSELVTAVSSGDKHSKVVADRAVMAGALRGRWVEAIQKLKQFSDSDVFVPEHAILPILSKDVTRRIRTAAIENLSLYTRIQQIFPDETSGQDAPSISVLTQDAELSANYKVTSKVQVNRAAAIYVLRNGVTLTIAASDSVPSADRNWFRIPLDVTKESVVSLNLSLLNAPTSPTPVTIVAVDEHGVPVKRTTMTLQPPAENTWEIKVVQVEKGKPEERPVTLEEMETVTSRRLRLLPSTLDPVTKMHVPIQLKLKLHRTSGISNSVRIRALHADNGTEAWSRAEPLVFPEGKDLIDIPFQSGTAPVAGAAPVKIPAELEISRGLIFEITPDDLPKKITSRFTITPRLLGPEEILRRPEPEYDQETDELVISLTRAPFDNSTALWPTALPAEVELSPELQLFQEPKTSLTALNAAGATFRIPFNASRIRKALGREGLEFGVSIAGIPHGWWWKLKEGSPSLLEGIRPQVRAFLSVDDTSVVRPITGLPNLLLGEGWDKARLTAKVFVHGGSFDRAGRLQLLFLREDTQTTIKATETQFEVRGRYVETVKVVAGENGVWQFSTTTDPYSVSAFAPGLYQLQNGTYDLRAVLERPGEAEDPITSDVQFTFDNTAPELHPDDVQLIRPKTNIKGPLKGSVQVTDPESGVVAVRVGLNAETMIPLTITPGTTVQTDFSIDASKGFPRLEQRESDNEESATLFVEAENQAGGKTSVKESVTFVLPGKAVPMVQVPGTIVVKLKSKSKFDVTVTGKGVAKDAPDTVGIATFDMLPPGQYTVKWKPSEGTLGSGDASVILGSGKTVTVGPGK